MPRLDEIERRLISIEKSLAVQLEKQIVLDAQLKLLRQHLVNLTLRTTGLERLTPLPYIDKEDK